VTEIQKSSDSQLTWKAIRKLAQKPGKQGFGFLGEYVHYNAYNYEEPTRRGIPKGKRIGFSREKYLAAMLVGITNWKLKKIAKECEVSYGLLRKWRTESKFSSASYFHAISFVSEIIKRTKKYTVTRTEDIEKYMEGLVENPFEINSNEPLNDIERILIDAHQFSDTVSFLIFKFLSTLQNESKNKNDSNCSENNTLALNLLNILTWGHEKRVLIFPLGLSKWLVSEIKDILEPPKSLNQKEKRKVMNRLTVLEHALNSYSDEFFRLYIERQPKGKKKQKIDSFLSEVAQSDSVYDFLKQSIEEV
jgi:hypothetical protein